MGTPNTMHPLAIYRQQKNLSQARLAAKLGVARTTVARWETDFRKIDAELLPIICKKTGIPAMVLRPDLARLMILGVD